MERRGGRIWRYGGCIGRRHGEIGASLRRLALSSPLFVAGAVIRSVPQRPYLPDTPSPPPSSSVGGAPVYGPVTSAGLGFPVRGASKVSLPHSLALSKRTAVTAVPGTSRLRCAASSSPSSAATARPIPAPRFIQHKKEAFWFHRFLSIVYDHVINPGHWTEDIRDDALEPADLYSLHLKVVDVGGGTGFITLGIVKHVNPKNTSRCSTGARTSSRRPGRRRRSRGRGSPSWRAMPRTCPSPRTPLTDASLREGCEAQKNWTKVVPWCSKARPHHGVLCYWCEETKWRLSFAGYMSTVGCCF